ncbi:hypothetical protein I545_0004 [Mycobacterium kansasii 662]|uniref:Uncharacterized protein n=1 Tax=Mycobacterium kansasii 662 TaxID=1299326 RepID=X7ZU28_MYCKA|nr:hypothetical protein I545_0004 [Mycobacterium kansasii 662]
MVDPDTVNFVGAWDRDVMPSGASITPGWLYPSRELEIGAFSWTR